MTREELKAHCEKQIEMCEFWAIVKGKKPSGKVYEKHKLILQLLEQETVSKESYDHEYFLRKELEMKIAKLEQQESFMNKLCVSEKVCEHDKNVVLDKLRAEILEEMLSHSGTGEEVIQAYADGLKKGLELIDKYKADKEQECLI